MAERLRWWTRGPYPRLLRRVADSSPGQSVLRLLDTAPATERSTGPRPVASLRDVLRTVDATRAWLAQHPQTTHLAHARAVARLALTITRGAADSSRGNPGAAAEAHRWEQINKKLHNLGELAAGNRDHLARELLIADDWLQRQLEAHQQTNPAGSDRTAELSTLRGRLPALAMQIDGVVAAATAQGQLLVPQADLDMSAPRRGVFMAKSRWRKATSTDRPIKTLRRELEGAARAPADRDQALRQVLDNPAALARVSFARPATPNPGSGQTPAKPAGRPAPTVAASRGRRGRARS